MFIEGYKPRVLDKTVSKYLSAFGAVCIEGPKWYGKTWTSRFNSSSEFRVASPDNNFQNRELAQMAPNMVFRERLRG